MAKIADARESCGLSSVEVCLYSDDKGLRDEKKMSSPNPKRWMFQRSLPFRRKDSKQSPLPRMEVHVDGPSSAGEPQAIQRLDTISTSDVSDVDDHVPTTILIANDPKDETPSHSKELQLVAQPSNLESLQNEAGCEGFTVGNILTATTGTSMHSSSNQPTTELLFPSLMGPEAEDTSVKSANYFDLSDFSPLDWSKTLTENDLMAGLAALYLAVGLTHPLMFLAGIMTAAGTATTATVGYDCWMENALCSPPESNELSPSKSQEQDANQSTRPQLTHMTSVPTLINVTSTLVDILPENWIETHYPPLEEVVADARQVKGLNVKQFFSVFFSDEAPYNFMQFQKKRGDKDIVYGKWKPIDLDEETTTLSMHPHAEKLLPDDLEYEQYITRTLEFQAKTNNTFFGPPYAKTKKEQRFLLINKRIGIMEVKTTLADIPFCDRFNVMERWIITAEKTEDGTYVSCFTTSVQVFFYKSCPFESQIRSKTLSSITDVCNAWYHMAIHTLRLSEQHKQERIRQEQSDEFTSKEQSDRCSVEMS